MEENKLDSEEKKILQSCENRKIYDHIKITKNQLDRFILILLGIFIVVFLIALISR